MGVSLGGDFPVRLAVGKVRIWLVDIRGGQGCRTYYRDPELLEPDADGAFRVDAPCLGQLKCGPYLLRFSADSYGCRPEGWIAIASGGNCGEGLKIQSPFVLGACCMIVSGNQVPSMYAAILPVFMAVYH